MHCLHRSNEINCKDISLVYVIFAAAPMVVNLLIGSTLNDINLDGISAEDLQIIAGEF